MALRERPFGESDPVIVRLGTESGTPFVAIGRGIDEVIIHFEPEAKGKEVKQVVLTEAETKQPEEEPKGAEVVAKPAAKPVAKPATKRPAPAPATVRRGGSARRK
jgi:hypothetical protein